MVKTLLQLPSAKHVMVVPLPDQSSRTYPALHEYVATLPTTRPPSLYAINKWLSNIGSSGHAICRQPQPVRQKNNPSHA